MARLLVTGGAGYVGSVCCRQLLAQGHSVEVVDDLSTGFADAVPPKSILHQFGIEDSEALSNVLGTRQFDAVFHFAARASVSKSVTDPGPFFEANIAGGISLLETLRKHDIRTFVFSSSAAVYGAPQVVPIPEDHPKKPVNPYGESKLIFEQILRTYAAAYGWSVIAFRYFNACGAGDNWGERHVPETHIIPLLLQTASGRRPFFEIFGTDYDSPDRTCLRDYVHVLDIAEAHLLSMRKMDRAGFHAYNIGTGISHSVKEIHKLAERISGKRIATRGTSRRVGDPPVLCANPQKLLDEFGWTPEHSTLENIVAGAWSWEQRQCNALFAEDMKASAIS